MLLITTVLALTACGEEENADGLEQTNGESAEGYLFDMDAQCELGTSDKALDPQSVYSSINYDYHMFYGSYRILGGKEAEEKYAKEINLIDYTSDYSDTLTAIPYRFEAGPHTFSNVINYARGKHFMRAYFYTGEGNMLTLNCAYTVDGNKLILNPVVEQIFDKENNKLSYELSDATFEYTFKFNGRQLTLSDATQSVSLNCGLNVTDDEFYVSTENYLSSGSERIDTIDYFRLYWDTDENKGRFVVSDENNNYLYGVAKLRDNGIITFTVPYEEGSKTYEYVYFLCDRDGIVLTDGKNTYYYCAGYSDRNGANISDNVSVEDMSKLDGLSEEKIKEISLKKADLLNDLAKAYEDAGVSVTINKESGEINLDASVLFDVNKYNISQQGKDLLKQFMQIYTSVVFDTKYDNFVSLIMVEGHTDTSGDYDFNLELSQKRAESVRDFCLSKECGISSDKVQPLSDSLKAVGYSSDNPIYGADGKVDMDASRRVSFRFVINLD